jgi:hypothetical protein
VSGAARAFVGVVLALAVMGGIVALSRAPYATGAGGRALLRLSWSGRPQRIERCRRLTEAELAERPAHMRQEVECEGRPARYAVRVALDGRTASLDTVTGGGLRGDRAIHMLREFPLEPGARTVAVEIARIDEVDEEVEEEEEESDHDDDHDEEDSGPGDRAVRGREERRRRRLEALPARLELTRSLRLEPGAVVLVTYEPSRRELLLVTDPRR